MALYRNIAGFDAVGREVADTAFERYMYSEGGGGGSYTPFTPIAAGAPIQESYPDMPQYNVWYAPGSPPTTNAPEPAVIEPPPSALYVSNTGATVQPVQDEVTTYMPQLPDSGTVVPTPPQETIEPVYNIAVVEDGQSSANMWPLVAFAAALVVAATGDQLIKRGQTMVVFGGLGVSYFLMMRGEKKIV